MGGVPGMENSRSFVLQIRHGRKQGPGIGVGRAVKDLPGCSHLYDLSGIHHADPVRHIGYNAQIMGNEDYGELLFSFDLLDLVQVVSRLDGHVQSRGGLVTDHDPGIAGQGNGNDDTLSPGELEGILLKPLLRLGIPTISISSIARFFACSFVMCSLKTRASVICFPIFMIGFSAESGSWKIREIFLSADLIKVFFLIFCQIVSLIKDLSLLNDGVFGKDP